MGGLEPLVMVFPLTVAYGINVDDAVNQDFDGEIDPEVTDANFPVIKQGEAELEAHLVCFRQFIGETEEVIEKLSGMGLRPGDERETIAFGLRYPDQLFERAVVGLGRTVVVNGRHYVLALEDDGGGPSVILAAWAGGWVAAFWFLAFRSDQTATQADGTQQSVCPTDPCPTS